MSQLVARLQEELNAARKGQDKHRTLLISTTLSEIRNRRIEVIRDLTDDEVADVIRKSIKKRRESADIYEKAGRNDLAEKELSEVALLQPYLPVQAADDEIRSIVTAAIAGGATNIGALMGVVMPLLKGKADGGRISAIAREEFARNG